MFMQDSMQYVPSMDYLRYQDYLGGRQSWPTNGVVCGSLTKHIE